MVRIWGVAVLAVAIWFLSLYGQSRPAPLGHDAPATQFSAARADAALARVLGPEKPHPVGSPENAATRNRLMKELSNMGVHARAVSEMSCYSEARWGAVECGTVTNIVAGVSLGYGKQVLLIAHRDSVPAGPGACDDGCGTATLLETIRALKARGATGQHPIVALFSDGEEAGLLGAAAYLRDPLDAAKTGVVINVEARGNSGPSFLFQTSPGDARLIDLYAKSEARYATSSLYGEIYKRLPNDTDLTPVLQAGITGYNFALMGHLAHYHTALDRRANIDPVSLQQHGDNTLELADALSRTDVDTLKSGNAVYLDVLGRWLPRMPASWALPLSIVVFLMIALAGYLTEPGRRELRRPLLSFFMPPLFLVGCVAIGFGLHGLAAWISGNADPSFAHPVWLRWSLAFGVLAVALPVSRGAGAICGWLWFAGLAIGTSIFAVGIAPYFLFPAMVAAPLLLVTMRGGRTFALVLSALAAAVIWIGLTAGSELIMGLKLHPLFMVSAAFGVLGLLPLLGRARNGMWLSFALSLVFAIGFAVTAGLEPAFSAQAPQPLNIRYVEQSGKAYWLADPVKQLPAELRAAAAFSDAPRKALDFGYVAPIGPAENPAPTATVARNGESITLDIHAQGDGIALAVPKEAGLKTVTVGGVTVDAPQGKSIFITCATPDCASARMVLTVETPNAMELTLIANRRSLPAGGEKLQNARPATNVTYQQGDETLLAGTVNIPAR